MDLRPKDLGVSVMHEEIPAQKRTDKATFQGDRLQTQMALLTNRYIGTNVTA
jgi:hypothetical protein